jgi:dihydrofolate reductase
MERSFDPDAVRRMKEQSDADLSIGGPHIAAQALTAGVVDECHSFLHPVVVGSGNSAFPRDRLIRLELLDERRFGSGAVHLHYGVRT